MAQVFTPKDYQLAKVMGLRLRTLRRRVEELLCRSAHARVAHLLLDLYPNQPGAEFHAFHPRFLIEQTISICTYEGVKPELRRDFLDRAWANLFSKD